VRHRKERGGYTEDLEALVVRYGAGGRNNNANVLSALIQDGTIRARKTDRGVEIWMEITPGNWIRQELHE
jgi:hypothetical protein